MPGVAHTQRTGDSMFTPSNDPYILFIFMRQLAWT